jgi:hypothetical protein
MKKQWMQMIRFLKGSWKDLLIAAIFISLSAALNASMDTIEHHHSTSVFSKLGSYFYHDWTRLYEKDPDGNLIQPLQRKRWNFGIWKPAIHPLVFDAWHLFKSLMIIMIICYGSTFVFARERIVFTWKKIEHWYLLISLIIAYGLVWILMFNLFYDHLLLL